MTLLPFFSIVGIAALLQVISRRSMAICIFVAVALTTDLLYLAGLCGCLLLVSRAVLFAGLLAFPVAAIVAVLKHQQRALARAFLSPGFAVFSAAALVFRTGYSNLTYHWWDEFSHWGRAVRELLLTDALPARRTVLLFQDYPPGAPLFEYFILRHTGTYSEAAVYFGHFLLLIAPLIVFLDSRTWRALAWTVIMFFGTVLLMFVHWDPLTTLNMDMVIAANFAASIFLVTLYPARLSTVALLSPVLFLMPLLKPSGLFFALVCIATALGNKFLRRPLAIDSQPIAPTPSAKRCLIGPVVVSALRKHPLGIFLSLSVLFAILLITTALEGYT